MVTMGMNIYRVYTVKKLPLNLVQFHRENWKIVPNLTSFLLR